MSKVQNEFHIIESPSASNGLRYFSTRGLKFLKI